MEQRDESTREQALQARDTVRARAAEYARRLDALYEISNEISSHLEIDRVLHSVTDKARELLGSDVAFICLQDKDDRLQVRSITGPVAAVCNRSTPLNAPLTARILAEREAVLCSAPDCHGSCSVVSSAYRRSHLAAPLRVQNRVIGALCVGRAEAGYFSDDDRRLLTKLANSAAIALENARLHEAVERAATLEERQRIAADMHDDLLQSLSYLRMNLHQIALRLEAEGTVGHVAQLTRLGDYIDDVAHDVRESIVGLRAPPAPPQPLGPRLNALVDSLVQELNRSIASDLAELPALQLPADDLEQVVRIVREAILNAAYHADADSIVVRGAQHESEIVLSIVDDGAGFDPATPPTGGNHFGLRIMQARADRIGGRLEIDSKPGEGTSVRLQLICK